VMDFDPSLLHEVNGRTAINPAMTAGKHRDAVEAHLDDLNTMCPPPARYDLADPPASAAGPALRQGQCA
jgi:hypothetical protein